MRYARRHPDVLRPAGFSRPVHRGGRRGLVVQQAAAAQSADRENDLP